MSRSKSTRRPRLPASDELHPIITRMSIDVRAVGGGWMVDYVIERERLWAGPPQTLRVERGSFCIFSYNYQNRHLLRGLANGLKDPLTTGKVKRRPL